jgi:hypothetical protein
MLVLGLLVPSERKHVVSQYYLRCEGANVDHTKKLPVQYRYNADTRAAL